MAQPNIRKPKEIMMVRETQSQEDSFVISVYCERVVDGVLDETTNEIERMTVDADELVDYANEYGTLTPSASSPGRYVWFSSECPRMDREHIEQGIDK